MTADKYTLWEDIVAKTSRFVARDFPDVSSDDLFQDLMMYVLSNKNLRNPDGEHVASGLYKRCVKFAWEYRKQSLYLTSQYSYRTSDVRKILETLFDYRDWTHSFLPDDARSLSDDDRLVVNSDVKRAYETLSEIYQVSIFKRYALKQIPTATGDKERLRRAVERMADYLNFYKSVTPRSHEGPGSRRVISNATARYIIEGQGGEED